MAKKRRRPLGSKNKPNTGDAGGFAAIQRKMDALRRLRTEVAADLRRMADAVAGGEGPMPWFQGQGVASPVSTAEATIPAVKQRRTMSADARARIAEAIRKRWAEQKSAQAGSAPKAAKSAKKGKRGPKAKKAGGHVGNG